jgi:transposase
MLLGPLLPAVQAFSRHLETIGPDQIIVQLTSANFSANCTTCGQASSRVHSHYGRILLDLPWGGISVKLQVRVRRFFCDNAACPRKIFAEALSDLAKDHARKTTRLSQSLRQIGLALGGSAGAALAALVAMPTSGDTILRLV